MSSKLITILGPTAVGKTKFAVRLADKFNGEIISADSRQVYRGMDIGTGKDLDEYIIDGKLIKYHMIDIAEPAEEFNLYRFNELFGKANASILERRKTAFLVGGSGMYISSIIQDYELNKADFRSGRFEELLTKDENELRSMILELQPKQHNITDLNDKNRLAKAIIVAESSKDPVSKMKFENLVIGITLDRNLVKERITARLKRRLKNGMIEEVEQLMKQGIGIDKLKFFGLEYKFIGMYLNDELNYNDMYQKLNSAIHSFAKRQMTWFRKMERENILINWLKPDEVEKASVLIEEFIRD